MFTLRHIATAAIFLLLAAWPRTGFCQPVYTYRQIDFPGAGFPGTVPTGINDAGEVIGYYYDGDAYYHGFTLEHGVYTAVNFPDTAFQTNLVGINDCGAMIGNIFYNAGFTVLEAFILENGKFTILNYPGSESTVAGGINGRGEIAGTYDVTGNTGFLYANGEFRTPASLPPYPSGLNDAGDVAGYYCPGNPTCYGSGTDTGFVYSQQTHTLTPIAFPGAPGEFGTFAAGINNSGEIAGFYAAAHSNPEGFLFAGGVYTTNAMPGGIGTQAFAINNAGVIVGSFGDGTGAAHGFIATPRAHPAAARATCPTL